MSVIMQEVGTQVNGEILYFLPTEIAGRGEVFALTKGADSILTPLCTDSAIAEHSREVDVLNSKGLRTLVFASRPLKAKINVQNWAMEWERVRQHGEEDVRYQEHVR